jgi:hypothetical protein
MKTPPSLCSGNSFQAITFPVSVSGRLFKADDDKFQGDHPIGVISYGYWLRRFGG